MASAAAAPANAVAAIPPATTAIPARRTERAQTLRTRVDVFIENLLSSQRGPAADVTTGIWSGQYALIAAARNCHVCAVVLPRGRFLDRNAADL